MTKNELIAAIREVEPERTASSLKKESVADLAMLWEEIKPVAKEVRFRDVPEVFEVYTELKKHRSEAFQPAFFSNKADKLREALAEQLNLLRKLADTAGVSL